MGTTDGDAVRAAVEAGAARLREAGRGVLYVCGPAGSGRSAVLAGIAAADPEAVLVDAAGRSLASVVGELTERTGLFGGCPDRRAGQPPRAGRFRTVLVANPHSAGPFVDGRDPARLRALLDGAAAASRQRRLRLVVEREPLPAPPAPPRSGAWVDVLELTDHQGGFQVSELEWELPAGAVAALRALAHARLRRLPAEGWDALCRAAGVDPADRKAAADSRWVLRHPDGFALHGRAPAEELRQGPGPSAATIHARTTDLLLAAPGPVTGWAARSLPGHALAAGRFDQLLDDARALAHVPQDALIDALRTAYADRAAAHGTHAAALAYLAGLALDDAPHGEWVARLAHDAHLRGQFARAEALAAACPEPLPFRTLWAHWRPNGDSEPLADPWHTAEIHTVAAVEYRGAPAVLTEDEDDVRFVRCAATGALLAGPLDADPADLRRTPGPDPAVRPRGRSTELPDRSGAPRTFHHPDAETSGAVGELLVLADERGACAVRVDPDLLDPRPRPSGSRVGRHLRLAPRRHDPADLPPLPALLARVFGPDRLHRFDPAPDTVTDPVARDLLTTVGLPSFESGAGYWLTPEDGLPAQPWAPRPGAELPPGAGPFHLIGGWLGAYLMLDGGDGRVLRMIPAHWPADSVPHEPLIGTTLPRFLTAVALQE
ncbi:SUKH-4 family immunity protein [Kitasatospora sp. NPDC088134]|uniref:SUKH-4 family immunity protein n=1 Tax=Kitasatospora sp. NPDC088134 TaxID=3364071 RepID=UPI00380E359C